MLFRSTDISAIGGGTVSGAISALNNSLANLVIYRDYTIANVTNGQSLNFNESTPTGYRIQSWQYSVISVSSTTSFLWSICENWNGTFFTTNVNQNYNLAKRVTYVKT